MQKKIITTLILVIMLFLFTGIPAFADVPGGMEGINQPWSGNSQLRQAGNSVLGIIQIIGTVFAVGTLMIIGARYMLSSPDDRASIKARAIPYIIGALLVFGATNIAKIVADFTNQNIK